MRCSKFGHIEINRAIAYIRQPAIKDLLHHFDLLRDMSGGTRLNTGWQGVENAHHIMEAHGIPLCYFHGFKLGNLGALCHPVLTIVGKVTYIGDIPYIAHLVAKMQEITINGIETAEGTAIAEVHVTVNGRATDIHPDVTGSDWVEFFLFARKGIVNLEWTRCCHKAQM